MMGHQRLLRSTAISAMTAPAKSTAAKRAPKRTMKPKTRPRPGFHGVIGTPLYSWMKLTHSSRTYAAMSAVVSTLLTRTMPNRGTGSLTNFVELRWTRPAARAGARLRTRRGTCPATAAGFPSCLRRSAARPGDAERQQAFVRQARPVAMHALKIGDAKRLGERR